MTTVYFIRHAEAEGNRYRIAHGHYNSLLTPRGWKQVACVEKRFADVHIDAVYASDLYRTCATATSIFQSHNLPLHREPRLREINVGIWEGQTWGDLIRLYPTQTHQFSHDLFAWEMEGGEDPRAVIARMEEAVREIAKNHPDQTVALFSHGYAIRLLLGKLQGMSHAELDKSPTGGNTAVSCLEVEGDTITVRFRDDDSHLAELDNGVVRPTAVQPGARFETVSADVINRQFDLQLEGGHCLLAYRQDEVIGFIQLLPEQGKGWIGAMGLLEPWRNMGFGGQLLGQGVMFYRAMGCDSMYIHGDSVDAGFLDRHGFVAQKDGVFAKEGTYQDWYL